MLPAMPIGIMLEFIAGVGATLAAIAD